MKKKKSFFLLFLVLGLYSKAPLLASEAGSSHYTPGAAASFIDFPTGIPYNFLVPYLWYTGSASVSRQFPIAGVIAADVEALSFGFLPTFQYDSHVKVLGGNYLFSLSIPIITVDVTASITGPQGNTISRTDSQGGLGDLYFSPLGFVWKKGNFSYQALVGIYAPSGSFETGRLANLGKNYWTFTPMGAFKYDNQKIGLEATAFTGFNFNTKNNATDYQSGQEFFLDFYVAKRFKNGFGVGGTGFVFQQITGDSGSGARLGSFKGQDFGMGPELSYFTPWGRHALFAMELKWLPEIVVTNRTQGHFVWFKMGFIWGLPKQPQAVSKLQ